MSGHYEERSLEGVGIWDLLVIRRSGRDYPF